MERRCEQCGAVVEAGMPFCPNCKAPQIRVAGFANRPATPPLAPGIPGDMQPPAEPAQLFPRAEHVEATPTEVHWKHAVPGALLAGFLLAVALNFPYASPFLLMGAAGGLAAAMYQRRSRQPLTPGMGARIGMIGGVLGFAIILALLAAEVAIGGGRLVNAMKQALAGQLARNPNPQVQQMMQQLLTPGGLAVVVGVGMLMFLAVVVVCSAIGGALGASLFGRRRR